MIRILDMSVVVFSCLLLVLLRPSFTEVNIVQQTGTFAYLHNDRHGLRPLDLYG